jgi:sugar/nucleoside kinase (ribokinase family)
MSIVVVGSIALDTIETPFGRREDVLGGSCTHFSYAASFFHPVSVVGVVGKDFRNKDIELLRNRDINAEGLQVVEGNTFRWSGQYEYDMSEAKTLSTCLNVFETFHPVLPESYRNADYVFLANIDPELQLSVLEQVREPKLVACDTMNLWLNTKRDAVAELFSKTDVVIVNQGEARLFSGEPSIIASAKRILETGATYVVIKKGEHGALLFGPNLFFACPGFPLETIQDPTGAGDAFAGGFLGYLAKTGTLDDMHFRRAVVYGCVMASFNVEDFGLDRLRGLTDDDIAERYLEYVTLTRFEGV